MQIECYQYNTVIVGSGAAGYSAADRLHQLGCGDSAIVTEGRMIGTSRNTGSDKQTYYKLTLSGSEPDSVTDMARTLFEGQSADGDLALAEAVHSVPCFLRLAELGVPFPTNRWGEYVGYKTDHDPRQRATSAGPLTSKLMTEALEKEVLSHGTPVFDRYQMIRILTDHNRVYGVVCLKLSSASQEPVLALFHCKNLILATGGPAGLYADSVYPASQHGASGIAFAAGVRGKNLTEWQYGIASVHPRWNVSGTYMQSLPRFYSVNPDGSDPRDFLSEAFSSRGEMLNQIFLKGYQWPFDTRKALDGSSRIDLLVYQERVLRGRKVYLDYRSNPDGIPVHPEDLLPEARTYLDRAGAWQSTPFERLAHMNQPAVDFYRSRGVDLAAQPLEIALCAQHNNGGLVIDSWWQTNIEGIFAIGEAAGSHGVYRPGGSALNAGQAGAYRAARYICARRQGDPEPFSSECEDQLASLINEIDLLMSHPANSEPLSFEYRRKMSDSAAAFRSLSNLRELAVETSRIIAGFTEQIGAGGEVKGLSAAYRLYDQLVAMNLYVSAMADYAGQHGGSRGSALYSSPEGRLPELAKTVSLPDLFRLAPDDGSCSGQIQEALYNSCGNQIFWRPVRPIPDRSEDFFENIWRSYREHQNITD